MGMISEFKEFAMKGNVVDLAVGVVIGGAFGKIVDALVAKVIMPPIGLLIGGVDFSKIAITLKEASVDAAGKEVPAVAIGVGDFLNAPVSYTHLDVYKRQGLRRSRTWRRAPRRRVVPSTAGSVPGPSRAGGRHAGRC